ncbi:hypothetical protein GPALN_005269 [Globodera pallida]|nr:hypothetical protein GPALN_005269 [Globodera pallida]
MWRWTHSSPAFVHAIRPPAVDWRQFCAVLAVLEYIKQWKCKMAEREEDGRAKQLAQRQSEGTGRRSDDASSAAAAVAVACPSLDISILRLNIPTKPP